MSWDGINGWLIHTLLRGENDPKQSDEIQAIIMYYPTLGTRGFSSRAVEIFGVGQRPTYTSETVLEKSLASRVVLYLLFSKQD